jgi:peptide/nickel transport system ATP-binding protein
MGEFGDNGLALEIRGLTTVYRQRMKPISVVRDVSLKIKRAEIFGLVGESGSGKSTVVRSIIRLLPSNAEVVSGEVLYGGENLLALSERQMRRIRGTELSMVFQDPLSSLNPVLTVSQQIGEGLRYGKALPEGSIRKRVLEVMKLVRIPDPERLLTAYPYELSGGLRQRVAIAIALVLSPRLLLADEPTTALDVTIQDQILKLLVELRDRLGMSVLLVTHDLGVIAQTCQQVAVMYAGRIVERGPVEAIFSSPAHPYTIGLLNSIPRGAAAESRLSAIPGVPPTFAELPKGCSFARRCPYAIPACRERLPPLEEHVGGHITACLRHRELRSLVCA